MNFLYRFEVLALDGLAANFIRPEQYTESTRALYRELYLLTNVEAPVSFPVEPFSSAFLPVKSGTGQAWTFEPLAIEHDAVRLDGEKASGQLKVSLPLEHRLAQLYALDHPGYQVWLTLAQHDEALAPQPLVIWVGQVVAAEFDEARCTLTLHHLEKLLTRPGLTTKHPRTCPHVLFDKSTCRVKAVAYDDGKGYFKYREDGFVLEVAADGMSVTVPEAANRAAGFFNNGFLVIGGQYSRNSTPSEPDHFPRSGPLRASSNPNLTVDGGYRRTIVEHFGDQLRLQIPLPPGLYTSQRVSLFAGCDGTKEQCAQKFNNTKNFGGYPFIPIKNPFEVGLLAAKG